MLISGSARLSRGGAQGRCHRPRAWVLRQLQNQEPRRSRTAKPKNHNDSGLWNQEPKRSEITEPKNQGSSGPQNQEPLLSGLWSRNQESENKNNKFEKPRTKTTQDLETKNQDDPGFPNQEPKRSRIPKLGTKTIQDSKTRNQDDPGFQNQDPKNPSPGPKEAIDAVCS